MHSWEILKVGTVFHTVNSIKETTRWNASDNLIKGEETRGLKVKNYHFKLKNYYVSDLKNKQTNRIK